MPDPSETHVLVVDDSALDRALLKAHLASDGYEPSFATNGVEALQILESDPDLFDVVLLDRNMPGMGGLALLGRLKEHRRLRMVPVILQTAVAEEEEIVEGIRAGAYYYLTKPYNVPMLLSVVRTAANDYAEFKELRSRLRQGAQTLRLLRNATFSIRTLEDARDLAGVLANACPDPNTAIIGLTELLCNAIEHGNVHITYEEKSALRDKTDWQREVERRLELPENASKRVDVSVEREDTRLRFTIRDGGAGFDWSRFLEIDPARAFDTHGRGIAMARRLSFESVEYVGCGNTVVATVRLH
jgi:CheY-like chemotaxis protein/anti-sigma regulatory factor (Ser/Thr protein kinase)